MWNVTLFLADWVTPQQAQSFRLVQRTVLDPDE